MEFWLFWKYTFIQKSIKGGTNGEPSSLKHKSKSKKTPILQRRGSKDSLCGQSNQPAYVEQLLELKEKKRSVINFDFLTQDILKHIHILKYDYCCHHDVWFNYFRDRIKKKTTTKCNSSDITEDMTGKPRAHTDKRFRQSQRSKVQWYTIILCTLFFKEGL